MSGNPFSPEENSKSAVGLRFNDGKVRMELLCPVAMEGCASVLTLGAKKYADHNWQKGMSWGTVIGSLLRHVFKFMRGEDLDPETGLPHVDHIMCNAMFLSNYYRNHKSFDTRVKQKEASL